MFRFKSAKNTQEAWMQELLLLLQRKVCQEERHGRRAEISSPCGVVL